VRVEDRILLILWHLADRWGRVSTQGVIVPLPLTHRLLARIDGAHRPSVTGAISRLTERGAIRRRADGSWLLCGEPPASLEALHQDLASMPWSARE
jgi:hypothetical protein